ncbi:MAG: zinc ribbon domain-containing protein [Clostridia bacterium]|nr:zinc ribbon domain-containing protein [Clostridia bacterium]
MTAKQIYTKTMLFGWMKLFLGLATVIISAILFGFLMLIGAIFGENGLAIMFIIWLSATGIVRFVIMHYFGYMVKAGHIAIISQAVTTGQLPENQFEAAKQMVTARFATSNVYFAIDKLVGGAVKQLQNALGKIGGMFDAVPGVGTIVSIGQMFIGISLGYIDECCLGYTFYKKDENAYKSAADGVVIYAQNWKTLLKSAAKTTLVVILAVILVTAACFLLFGGLFRLFNWNMLVAFLLALFTAIAIKYAFIDSWILTKTMVSYMEVAPSTQITFDLYDKLCKLSSKFKSLFEKAPKQQPAYAAAGSGYVTLTDTAENEKKPKYCPSCGAVNDGGKFCAKCGGQL